MSNDADNVWVTKEQLDEHCQKYGQPNGVTDIGMEPAIARGKTEFFGKLTKQLAERHAGLGWKDAWALRLSDLGEKNRLPRGFNAKNLRGRAAGRDVLRQIKQAVTWINKS
jgi:hypothetical protein